MPARTFEEFWPWYLADHLDRRCRALHFAGDSLAFVFVLAGVVVSPLWLAAAPVAGYGLAWVGHFVFERNRPAAFGAPLWSFRGGLRMYRLMWRGALEPELARARTLARR